MFRSRFQFQFSFRSRRLKDPCIYYVSLHLIRQYAISPPASHSANGTYHKMTNRKNVVLVVEDDDGDDAGEAQQEGDREEMYTRRPWICPKGMKRT